jgi:hypothetical protein
VKEIVGASVSAQCTIGADGVYTELNGTRVKSLLAIAILCAPVQAQSLDGVWRSQGYGYVFDIHGPVLKAFEVTTTTCVPGFTAQRQTIAAPGWEATFKSKGRGIFFVRSDGADDHKLLHYDGALSNLRINRLPRMPAVCAPPTANTPLDNFEVFTRTWAEHYISFDLKHTDWDKLAATYKMKVTSQTTPAQLFEIFVAMIRPFGDLHTGVEAPKLKRETEDFWRPGTDRLIKGEPKRFETRGRRALFAVTDRAYLQGPLRNFCNRQLQYSHIDDTTGYLRILSFGGYSRHGDLMALESALDTIFSDRTFQALVIDVRLAFGGDDRLGLAIAARLATSEYVAYTKQARADPIERDQWTPGDPVSVLPSSRPGFRGPVVELIGPITPSAAETFTQALMGRTPHVTRIGENTQGVFSDVLDRRLPNGWKFGLPNEVYRTAEGTAFDVQGIPPDIAVPVFADQDVASGNDPGMAKAVQILRKK